MVNPPTTKELEGKWWYRLLKVFFWIIISLTAIAPFVRDSENVFLDLSTGILINGSLMLILWKIISYIVYGKTVQINKKNIEQKKEENRAVVNAFLISTAIAIFIFLPLLFLSMFNH